MLEYLRVSCAVPDGKPGDVTWNVAQICYWIAQAEKSQADVVVFPELAITGYTCGDLFLQESLQRAARNGLMELVLYSEKYPCMTFVVGLPLKIDGLLYNCAATISCGRIYALTVKTFIPNYGCANEMRWFASAQYLRRDAISALELGFEKDYMIPVGNDLLISVGDDAMLGVEICEDLWAPIPPSSMLALGGGEVIVNLAASHAFAGKKSKRRELVNGLSASLLCGYAFCSAGFCESTQTLVYSGNCIVSQCGKLLGENKESVDSGYLLSQDIDLSVIRTQRQRNTTFREASRIYGKHFPVRRIQIPTLNLRSDGAIYPVSKTPFFPANIKDRKQWCRDVFEIQVTGLMRRLEIIDAKPVVGVSGGLDSTLALFVSVEAVKRLGRSTGDVQAVTMPCFGTSDRTYQNAWKLMRLLQVTPVQIDIRQTVMKHFQQIGQDPQIHDATYENAQARERTQVLMDYAGKVGGIVVGTGDLSELALGWCTYNGDHMSMYSVNSSIPKTAIPEILKMLVEMPDYREVQSVTTDILETPISPELLPPDSQGKILQKTQDVVGPYSLHDFFLYHILSDGFSPKKGYTLACRAFQEDFDKQTILKWLRVFYKRFFSQQFKRNCQPDGVCTDDVCLNPHIFQMPSDASMQVWLEELKTLE